MGLPIYSCSIENIKKSIPSQESMVKYCIDSSRTLIYMGQSLKLEDMPKPNKKMEFSEFEDKFLNKVKEIGLKEVLNTSEDSWFNVFDVSKLKEFEQIYKGEKSPTPETNPDKRVLFAYHFLSTHFPEIYEPIPIYEIELSLFEIHEDVGSFPPQGHPNDPYQTRFFIHVLNDFLENNNNRLTNWFNDNFKLSIFERDLGMPSKGIQGFQEIIPGIVMEAEVVIKPHNKKFIANHGETEWYAKFLEYAEKRAQEENVSAIEITKRWEGRIYRKYKLLLNNYWGDELNEAFTKSNTNNFESAAFW